jgi:lipoate-protein ligase A
VHYLDVTLPTLAENLALDEALLLAAEEGEPEVLRLWEWPTPAVVLGAAGKLLEEVHVEHCRADGVPIFRRSSGGGTVLLNSGCMLYSLVLTYDRAPELTEVRPSYRYILGRIRDALAPGVPGIELAGISDLAIDGRKVSGNSQQRKRRCLLHHGTLLFDYDLKQVGRYLPNPQRQPEYRVGRDHLEFIANFNFRPQSTKNLLQSTWNAETLSTSLPLEMVRRLVEAKYSSAVWIEKR